MRSFDVAAAMNAAAVSCSSRAAPAPDGNSPELAVRIARGDAGRDHHVIADRDVVEAQLLGLGCDADQAVRSDQGAAAGCAATDLHLFLPLELRRPGR